MSANNKPDDIKPEDMKPADTKPEEQGNPAEASAKSPLTRAIPTRRSTAVSWKMTVWMTLVWILLNQDISLLTALSGIVISALLQLIFPMPRVGAVKRLRPLRAAWLILHFLWDMLVAAVEVSWLVLRRRPVKPIMVGVELYSEAELYLTIVSNMTCLVPGSIVVRAQINPSRLLLHVLDGPTSGGSQGVADSVHRVEMRVLQAIGSPQEIAAARAKAALDEALRQNEQTANAADSSESGDCGCPPAQAANSIGEED